MFSVDGQNFEMSRILDEQSNQSGTEDFSKSATEKDQSMNGDSILDSADEESCINSIVNQGEALEDKINSSSSSSFADSNQRSSNSLETISEPRKRRSKRLSEITSKQEKKERETPPLYDNVVVGMDSKKRVYIASSEGDLSHTKSRNKRKKQTEEDQEEASVKEIDSFTDSLTRHIVTGSPLEIGPSIKLQKEALWKKKNSNRAGRKGKQKGGHKKVSSKEPTPEVVEKANTKSSEEIERLKTLYDSELQTSKSDSLTKPSNLRDSVTRPVSKEEYKKYTVIRIPASKSRQVALNPLNAATPTGSNKKKKVRKIILNNNSKLTNGSFGFGGPMDLSQTPRSKEPIDNNEEFCSCCGEPGSFLCCENCPKSFHFQCLDPPLDESELPEDDWYCDQCTFKMAQAAGKIEKPEGIFSGLLLNLKKTNPHRFELPKNLKERYAGVKIDKNGVFQDEEYKAPKEVQKGVLQQLEPIRAYDKSGLPYFCYKCGETATHGKEITKCEYCSLVWHLDCLDPPLASAKMLGTKWRCPNHIEDAFTEKRRRTKNHEIVDVAMSKNFKSRGDDVEIANEASTDAFFNNDEDVSNVFMARQPEFLKIKDEQDGLSSAIPKELQKNFVPPRARDIEVIYKIRESGVLSDFFNKVKEERTREIEEYNSKMLNLLDSMNHGEKDKNNQEVVRGLMFLQGDYKRRKLQNFVSCILDNNTNIKDSEEELEKLRKVKNLIEMVGSEKLINFLEKEAGSEANS